MTKNKLGKPNALHVNKTVNTRQRRLEVLQLISPEGMSKLEDAYKNSHSSPESSDTTRRGEKSDGLVYGYVSMMGRRRAMEDTVTVAPPGWLAGEYCFFAVYDGHGGARVAEKCGEKMHKFLAKQIKKAKKKEPEERGLDWEKVMVECFSNMDEELEEDRSRNAPPETEDRAEPPRNKMMGSTAVVVVVGKEEIVVANCGDSRAVLCRGGVAVPMSIDHKPDRADEKERIEAAGGNVINWNGWRVQGVLTTSRSLGDQYLKPYVTSEPEVTVITRSESDDFLIIATDGLFDVVCNKVACEFVKKCFSCRSRRQVYQESGASEAATMLAELAIAKGSRDNISVIVVQLNNS